MPPLARQLLGVDGSTLREALTHRKIIAKGEEVRPSLGLEVQGGVQVFQGSSHSLYYPFPWFAQLVFSAVLATCRQAAHRGTGSWSRSHRKRVMASGWNQDSHL